MKLEHGRIYYDNKNQREVEFQYTAMNGDAVCCDPGDSRGGMQSSFLVDPVNLTLTARKCCPTCGQEIKS